MDLVQYMQDGLPSAECTRGLILDMQAAMQGHPLEIPVESLHVQHVHAPGVYAREMTIPEGTVIVGKLHKHAHVNIISVGRVRVLTEFGLQELVGPCTFVSQPGTKRVVYALENTVWTTIHPTQETDLAAIEREVIAIDYSELRVLT